MKYKLLDIVKVKNKNYKPSEVSGEIIMTNRTSNFPYVVKSFGGKYQIRCKERVITPIEKNFFSIQVGDIVVNKGGDEAKVLEVGETSFLLSYWDDFEDDFETAGLWYKKTEAKKHSWKIKKEDEVIEIKMSKKKAKELGLDE